MAVIIRKLVQIGPSPTEVRAFLPEGVISREAREQAQRLDAALREQLPLVAKGLQERFPDDEGQVRRWFEFGRCLRTTVENPQLVTREDLSTGRVWIAAWWHMPEELKPRGSSAFDPSYAVQHKRKDLLSLCYEISGFEWSEVSWIQRWDDWHQLAFRPGILRDTRILVALGDAISATEPYPTRAQFRSIVKELGRRFPTRRLRDSEVFDDNYVRRAVADAVKQGQPTSNHADDGGPT